MNEIVALACKIIRKDPALADGYNAVGFSQGGLFLFGYLFIFAKLFNHHVFLPVVLTFQIYDKSEVELNGS